MRLVKGLIPLAGLFVFFGVIFLIMDGGGNSSAQVQSEKPAIWGNDVLVHTGWVSRYSRNGYSSNYDEDSNHIYVAVAGYSSGPDTCWLYKSTNGGTTWTLKSYWPEDVDISNPQVVVGKGSNYYLFLFGRVNEENGNIIVNRMPLPSGSWVQYTIGGASLCDIRNFVAAGEQGSVYNLHIAYDSDSGSTYYLRSNTYGESWNYYDTLDGDQPHLATVGLDGSEHLYLTWRMDGENGALYALQDLGVLEEIAKNLNLGIGSWKYHEIPFSVYGGALDYPHCILQTEDGAIYVGGEDVDAGGTYGRVFKSTDGGKTWSTTGTLSGAETVWDLLEVELWPNNYLLAGTGQNARVFTSTNGGDSWSNTGSIAGANDVYCLAVRSGPTLYIGTGDEGGVFKSTNMGTNWVELADLLGAEKIYSIIVTQAGTLIAGAQKDGDSIGFFRSINDGVGWPQIRPAGVKCVYSLFQASDGTIYAGVKYGPNCRVMKSAAGNDGVNWTYTNYPTISGVPWTIMEDSEGAIYVTNTDDYIRKTTDQGTTWITLTGAWTSVDLIQSKPQIMVKRSTNRGVNWQTAKKVCDPNYNDYSDPKLAGTQGTSSYRVWVAHSARLGNNWYVLYYYSTDQGTTWLGSNGLCSSGETQPLCDLTVKRGDDSKVHAAYCVESDGSREIRYAWTSPGSPTGWVVQTDVSDLRPTLAHAPEISFYQDNPVVFYSWGYGIPYEYPRNLYVDAQHFTGVEQGGQELSPIAEFSLSQNYPNPFNPATTIRFKVEGERLKVPIPTTLKIHNVLGQLVRTLVDEPKWTGSYTVIWDGKDDRGSEVASGVYLCKLQVGDQSQTKKMVLIR
jgi:hypothetical protein